MITVHFPWYWSSLPLQRVGQLLDLAPCHPPGTVSSSHPASWTGVQQGFAVDNDVIKTLLLTPVQNQNTLILALLFNKKGVGFLVLTVQQCVKAKERRQQQYLGF